MAVVGRESGGPSSQRGVGRRRARILRAGRAFDHDRAWIRGIRAMGMVDQTVLFSAPNEIVRDLLDNRFRPLVITRMSAALGREINFAVVVRPTPDPDVVPDEPPSERSEGARRLASVSGRSEPAPPPKLNERYTFETFVIGDGNEFLHAAAVAVAEAPGRSYNPLFVYGDSGLGKTHLLHAIAHDVAKMHPELRICYVELRGVHRRVHQRDPATTSSSSSARATAPSTSC